MNSKSVEEKLVELENEVPSSEHRFHKLLVALHIAFFEANGKVLVY